MTPNEQEDGPETAQELTNTEFHPYSADDAPGAARGADETVPGDKEPGDTVPGDGDTVSGDTVPDVPPMERLPDYDVLPDPGFPQMPEPAAVPSVTGYPVSRPTDGPDADSWPYPPVWPPPAPAFTPARPAWAPEAAAEPPTRPDALAGAAPAAPHKQVRPPDPYAAPRVPEDAPPLHGPSVPWSEVRAAADYEVAGEEPATPPELPPHLAPHLPPPGAPAAPQRPAPPYAEPYAGRPVTAQVPSEALASRPTSDMLTSDLLLPGNRAAPGAGWRRTVYRATGGLVRVGESAANLRRRDLISRIKTPVAGGHHRIAVLSLKGGVGKTTVTVGLGATLASLRGDRVIAVDGNPDRGTLSDKVRVQTPATIRDLLNERAMVGRYADVRAFTSQMPSRLEILASDRDPGVSVAFSADDYRAVVGVLERYYSICITDCGTGLLHSAMAGILELADQIVLVSSPSVDGARSASATLDWLEAHRYGDLVRGGVVVISAVRGKSRSTVDLDRLGQHFAARCRSVVRVPYDPHLEEGAEFELDYLSTETADAYLTLAAEVADGFARPGRSAAGAAPGFPLS
jgi:MinD-like ATPase involved in chromosome partitioning or flagellar assembly